MPSGFTDDGATDNKTPQQYIRILDQYFNFEINKTKDVVAPGDQHRTLAQKMVDAWESERVQLAKKNPARGDKLTSLQNKAISLRAEMELTPLIQLSCNEIIRELEKLFITEQFMEETEKKFIEMKQGNLSLEKYLLSFVEMATNLRTIYPKSQYNEGKKKCTQFIKNLAEPWRRTMLQGDAIASENWPILLEQIKVAIEKMPQAGAHQLPTKSEEKQWNTTGVNIQTRLSQVAGYTTRTNQP